jgi:hypothetical protein
MFSGCAPHNSHMISLIITNLSQWISLEWHCFTQPYDYRFMYLSIQETRCGQWSPSSNKTISTKSNLGAMSGICCISEKWILCLKQRIMKHHWGIDSIFLTGRYHLTSGKHRIKSVSSVILALRNSMTYGYPKGACPISDSDTRISKGQIKWLSSLKLRFICASQSFL